MQENPGRQSMSGSFNPIDVGEWSGQVYIGQTEKFFAAISSGDRYAVAQFLRQGADVGRRDHVGRSCLHLAIMSNAVDIACDLIDAGARLTARLVDGRNSLHLAVQMDQLVVVRKLFERSAINAHRGTMGNTMDVDSKELANETRRETSWDDWLFDDEDAADQPDVLDVNLPDWDPRSHH